MNAPSVPFVASAAVAGTGLRVWLPVLLAAAAAWPAEAAIYRCQQDGQLQFSDRPCAAGAQPAQLPPATVVMPEPGVADLAKEHERRTQQYRRARDAEDGELQQRRQQQRADETRIRAARQRGDVVQGMTATEVHQLLGKPAQVSTHSDAVNGDTEVWHYRDGKRSGATVSLRDGLVVQVRGARRKDADR